MVKACGFHLTLRAQQSSQRGEDVRGLNRVLRREKARLALLIAVGGKYNNLMAPSGSVKCKLLLLGMKMSDTLVPRLGGSFENGSLLLDASF